MQKIYPRLLAADVIILASPIFFYGVTGWAKALVDRTQAFWAKKYLVKDPSLGEEGKKRRGFFISVAATKGKKVFEGAILTAKYFFDVMNARYAGELLFRGIDAKGDIRKDPDALRKALDAGRSLVKPERRGPEMEPSLVQEMRNLVDENRAVYVATANSEGVPHIAVEHGLTLLDEQHLVFRSWFCLRTIENLDQNPQLALAILDPVTQDGVQVLGEMERIERGATLNGFSLEGEKQWAGYPQSEHQLLIRITKIFRLSTGPHSDEFSPVDIK
jgi:hypothetical protein